MPSASPEPRRAALPDTVSQFTDIVRALPPQVPFVPAEGVERRSGRRIEVRLGANESPFGISPRAREAALEALTVISHYCDSEAHALRERLAALHRVAMANIVIGSGIDDLLGLCVRAFVGPGRAAVMTQGSYPTFGYHVLGHGATLVSVPYRDDANDPAALLEAAERVDAHLIYLANPDNPGGSAWPLDVLDRFLADLPARRLVILDEAYADFLPAEIQRPIDVADPRVIRLRTFSKAHGLAGTRIGYALAHEHVIAAFDKIRLHYGVNLLAQRVALASLDDPGFVADVVAQVAEGRRDYERLASEIGLRALPSWTNFVALDVGSPERSRQLVDQLFERGVWVRRASTGTLARCIRVSVGTPAERERFGNVLRELWSNP
jgi:histidinol-phosphate aminotransferase